MSPKEPLALRLVIHLARNKITSDSHKVRLLFADNHLNHVHRLLIALEAFSKMQVS